jgi:DNA-binding transcriptional ArsR family regulator
MVSIYLPLVKTYYEAGLNALADATRRAILERLLTGPMAVGELARDFPVSRPAVSQHLRVLKEAGLVGATPEGNRRLYRLDPEGFDSLREYLDQFWTGALTAFQKSAEERPKGRGRWRR